VQIEHRIEIARELVLTLAKADDGGLGSRVVGEPANADETAHTSELDNVTLVVGDHVRAKSGAGDPVTGEVDVDEFLHTLHGRIEHGKVVTDPGIVDEDRGGGAELFLDRGGRRLDGFGVGDVAANVQRDVC